MRQRYAGPLVAGFNAIAGGMKVAGEDIQKRRKVTPLVFPTIAEEHKAALVAESDDDAPTDIPDKPRSAADLEPVSDIPVRVSAVLGKTTMTVAELTKLGRGAVIELNRKVGEAVDIYLNNRLVARGEVVVVDDRLGVTMTEIIKSNRG